MTTVPATNLGFPRLGANRELKVALEDYWGGRTPVDELNAVAARLRAEHWARQQRAGIDHIPSNDFSLYDQVLDTAVLVGAVPDAYRADDGRIDVDAYFTLARGGARRGEPLPAWEMTKWFDTNYHYLIPELAPGQRFELAGRKPLAEFHEAAALGYRTRPVVLGPLSFLLLAKGSGSPLGHLPALVPVYEELLSGLAAAGADWIQIDEPCLGLDLDDSIAGAYPGVYGRLADVVGITALLLTTYFTGPRRLLPMVMSLPVDGVHLDLVAEPDQLDAALELVPHGMALSLGVVDGRNIWRADLDLALAQLEAARDRLGPDRLMVAPSCSLLHLPVDLEAERRLDPEVRSWLAFAQQRLDEVATLARAVRDGREAVADELAVARAARAARAASPRVTNAAVRARLAKIGPEQERRATPYAERRAKQAGRVPLPLLPTTTIGSFPQTAEVRSLRARHRTGELGTAAYEARLGELMAETIRFQESVGLDVLVHGEYERNDMVEYFGQQLEGMAFTEQGWVQSYGSRGVKPPIIFGDVDRPAPMTVEWWRRAQSLTSHPVKGMLTGPVTILAWSFVRDDQPPADTCRQIALALRDEVADLEAAGAAVIQIDEPALRELLPLHEEDRPAYLGWAVAAFGLASAGVADDTQIHTHMCYGNFEDVIDSIASLDADVISIETSRSAMQLLGTFTEFKYPNEIGPGVWDIHSPRVPDVAELAAQIERAVAVLDPARLWVNPDCGLKTRRWEEVEPSLRNLVEAAGRVRRRLEAEG